MFFALLAIMFYLRFICFFIFISCKLFTFVLQKRFARTPQQQTHRFNPQTHKVVVTRTELLQPLCSGLQ